MKFCPQCGNQIKEGQSFCNKCGSDLKVLNNIERINYMKVRHLKNKRWPYILFVILIVAILISGGLTYYFFL